MLDLPQSTQSFSSRVIARLGIAKSIAPKKHVSVCSVADLVRLDLFVFRIILSPNTNIMTYSTADIGGLGLTKQRQCVLQVIHESEKHLTANEVFEVARGILPGISFATVYNSLRYLKTEGLIGEIQLGHGAHRYDRNLTRHDHAVCNSCGSIVDLKLALPPHVFERASELTNFHAESIELTVRGRCPECR